MKHEMSPMERVLTALKHQEPDRVPLLLSLTLHGAKLKGVSIQRYYSDPVMMAEAQVRLAKMYGNDFVNSFTYASAEAEAFGGSTMFYEDGPPNSGEPSIQALEDIESLEVPDILGTPALKVTIDATHNLKEKVGEEVPILGVTMAPFSLPVMQMGFENYFDLLFSGDEHYETLMQINQKFQNEYANLLLEAGATAIVYFDPLSSPTIIPKQKYLGTGFKVAKASVAATKGPVLAHFASGRTTSILEEIAESGFIGFGASVDDDLTLLKKKVGSRLTIVGNLNGLEMPNWTADQVDSNVMRAVKDAAPGGGFVLSDNHGEIPWQVRDETIERIASATRRFGRYPIA